MAVAAARDGQTILASQVDAKGGATWISRDAGLTWSRLANHALLEAPQGVLLAIDRRDPRHLFAADAGGTIISSAESGQSWQTLRDAT